MLHVARGHKLPLLHVHRPAGGRGGQQDVGLPAEKRRNLEQVADLPGGGGLVRQMHVGRHRQAGRLPDPIEHGEAFVDAWATEGADTRPVRLVVRGLENHLNRQSLGEFDQVVRDLEAPFEALDHAGPGDHQQRLIGATTVGADHGRQVGIHGVAWLRERTFGPGVCPRPDHTGSGVFRGSTSGPESCPAGPRRASGAPHFAARDAKCGAPGPLRSRCLSLEHDCLPCIESAEEHRISRLTPTSRDTHRSRKRQYFPGRSGLACHVLVMWLAHVFPMEMTVSLDVASPLRTGGSHVHSRRRCVWRE